MAQTVTKNKPPTLPRQPVMVRVSGAAAMLDVSDTTIRRWCADGILPFGWFQGQRRIKVSDIERLVDKIGKGKM